MFQTIHTIVFQALPGGGNPCPVTLNADELTTEEMQRMAKEFGEECAFLMKPTRPDCDVKVRYFLPLRELDMCMHATIGSATVLVEKGIITKSPIMYETTLGSVQIDWEKKDGKVQSGVHQFLPKHLEKNPTEEEVCKALRIDKDVLAPYPLQSVATSTYKLIVPLKKRETLDSLDPDFEYLWELCDKYEITGFYPYALETDENGKSVFCARQFPKRAGYNEDPATGVAASALGTYLVDHKVVPVQEGWNSFKILQGFAMGRPSEIGSDIEIRDGKIVQTRVCGSAFLVEK